MRLKPPAVIFGLGCHDTIGLEIARSLARMGVHATAISYHGGRAARYSRSCRFVECPHACHNPDRLLDFLISFAKRRPTPLVLFTGGDEEALFVSRHWAELQRFYRCHLPPAELTPRIVDKRTFYEAIGESGRVIPQCHFPTNWNEFDDVRDQVKYPSFVKPTHSFQWSGRGNSKGWLVHNEGELRDALRLAFSRRLPICVQAVVPGPTRNLYRVVAYINCDGRLLACLQFRKLRDRPAGFGLGTYVETIHHPELANLAMAVLERLGYRGLGGLEFKLDPRDGSFKLLEINPRLELQCSLYRAAGIDFAQLVYRDLIGENPAPQFAYQAGVRWLHWGLDTRESMRQIRAGELSLRKYLWSLAQTRVEAHFSWDDPLPAVTHYGMGIVQRLAQFASRPVHRGEIPPAPRLERPHARLDS